METDINTKPMSVGDWFITILLAGIPIIGWIMLLVWAFGSGTNPNKATWAKAVLIWAVIAVAVATLSIIIFGAALMSIFQGSSR